MPSQLQEPSHPRVLINALGTCSRSSNSSSTSNSSSKSVNSNNLNSLIGGSIRILNSTDYSKQLNQPQSSTKEHKSNFQSSCMYLNTNNQSSNTTSVSMKNINEIQPSSARAKNDYSANNYINLQLALRAATAALQKSKITASSNFIPGTSSPYSSSSSHNQVYVSQQHFNPSIDQSHSKSNVNLNIKSATKSPSASSSTSSTTSKSSTQSIFNSNQSLFQPYSRVKDIHNKETKIYRNTLVIDTAQSNSTPKLNNNSSDSSSSSSSASNKNNAVKLDSSEYDNIEHSKKLSSNYQNKQISIKLNPDNVLLKRQKSASTEFLNFGNCYRNSKIYDSKNEIDIDEDSLNNFDRNFNFGSTISNLDNNETNKSFSNLRSNSPQPPKIQPFSGVLSKSLFSVVLKPQPLKPLLKLPIPKSESQIPNRTPMNKFLSKKKCVSTTNLVFESSPKDSDQSPLNKIESLQASNSSKSVTTLNSIRYDLIDSSDNSINIDEVEVDYENEDDNEDLNVNDQAIDVIISDTCSNSNEKRVFELENQLRLKTNEVIELKNRLNVEIKKNELSSSQRKVSLDELEGEKQVYEQKLSSLKAHFNQQLCLFEQNERLQMQDKLSSLQNVCNDLKQNYKKNLENELKSLKVKLNESEAYAEQLLIQLQAKQVSSSRGKVTLSSLGTQTYNLADRDQNNNCNSELLFYLKKLKLENSELKLQMETERRRFQCDKEKLFFQFQNCLQNNKRNSINMSNENLMTQASVPANFKSSNLISNQVNLNLNQNKQNMNNLNNNNSMKVNSNQTKQPLMKNVLLNHQHYL